jgi:hypothetical protein
MFLGLAGPKVRKPLRQLAVAHGARALLPLRPAVTGVMGIDLVGGWGGGSRVFALPPRSFGIGCEGDGGGRLLTRSADKLMVGGG